MNNHRPYESRDTVKWHPRPEELDALKAGGELVITIHDLLEHDPGKMQRKWEMRVEV